ALEITAITSLRNETSARHFADEKVLTINAMQPRQTIALNETKLNAPKEYRHLAAIGVRERKDRSSPYLYSCPRQLFVSKVANFLARKKSLAIDLRPHDPIFRT